MTTNQTPATEPHTTRAAWDAIAQGYDRTNTPSQMWVAGEGLTAVGLRSGMRFLDVAAGSGALSIPAARLGARVEAIDQSPVMLKLLTDRARSEKLDVHTRVMDGHTLEFEDDTFDVAGSQFGVMLFPDAARAMREMVRVVRPGGHVLITAYGDPHQIEFLGFLVTAVQSVRPEFTGPPMDPPPLEFQFADPEVLRAQLAGAGLSDVTVVAITETTPHASGDDLWEWIVWSNPIAEEILSGVLALTGDERTIVRQRLGELVRERAADEHVARLTNPVNIGVGTK